MPLAWCVGAHGHNAIELCAGPTCHQGDALPVAMRVQPNAKAASIEAVSAHGEPCIDRTVMHEQLQDPEVHPLVGPLVSGVPAPIVVEQTSMVRSHRRVSGKLCWRSTAEPPLKSTALRI